jgi:hypothetical protein
LLIRKSNLAGFHIFDALSHLYVTKSLLKCVHHGSHFGRRAHGMVVPLVTMCDEWLDLQDKAKKYYPDNFPPCLAALEMLIHSASLLVREEPLLRIAAPAA